MSVLGAAATHVTVLINTMPTPLWTGRYLTRVLLAVAARRTRTRLRDLVAKMHAGQRLALEDLDTVGGAGDLWPGTFLPESLSAGDRAREDAVGPKAALVDGFDVPPAGRTRRRQATKTNSAAAIALDGLTHEVWPAR